MVTLFITLAAVALVWMLAFAGAPLIIWTVAIGAFLGGLYAMGSLGVTALAVLGLIFVAVALLFNLPLLRRSIVTRPIFSAFKRVLPEMSSTEREALEAGDIWWEGEMFRGRPQWNKLLDFQYTQLTSEERGFLNNEVEEVCRMMDDWRADFEQHDLPPQVWQYLKDKGFFGMLIKKEHGGLGFSAAAQSAVVTKLATKSIALAVTVMVPNSLGPGELLMHYGTPEQQKRWLPGLAKGQEIPCFGLTGPEAGSDAAAMPDTGVVGYGEFEGKRTLGIRLNFEKRYITLAPVATVVGLAFKLRDPEGLLGDRNKIDYGITCALVPANLPGISIGRRHHPGSSFMNGPIFGKDVFFPLDWIVGGPKMAGKGWRMLVECLSAGRGISLPALATAAGQTAYRTTGAYARIRRQFKTPIGLFEGVQEATGRIAGLAYTLEAMRLLTASAVDHCTPSVVTAISKYHMTEMMRRTVLDALDVHGGRGVQQGPRNYLSSAYKATPIAITVEGSNILTRNLMIFGQGAIRCHPYVFPEMEAARKNDLAGFDRLLWSHVGFSINRGVRAFTLGLTSSRVAKSPVKGRLTRWFQKLEHMSAALAFVSDVTMGVLGGELKRKERLSARLGDVLSHLYIASAVMKYCLANGQTQEDLLHTQWAVERSFAEMYKAFDEFFINFPIHFISKFLRFVVFPLGRPFREVTDRVNGQIGMMMMEQTALRDRITWLVFKNGGPHDAVGRMENAFNLLLKAEPAYNKYYKAANKGELAGNNVTERLADAVRQKLLTKEEADLVAEYDKARFDSILADDFSKDYVLGDFTAEKPDVVDLAAARTRMGVS